MDLWQVLDDFNVPSTIDYLCEHLLLAYFFI